jgi:hypothetical protein
MISVRVLEMHFPLGFHSWLDTGGAELSWKEEVETYLSQYQENPLM